MTLRHFGALCLLLLCSLLARAQSGLAPIPPLDSPVVDTTGTLSPQDKAALVQQAEALQQRKGSQLQILMVPTTAPEDIADYAQRAFVQWGIGRQKVNDGVLVVVAKDDRRARIHTGYGLEGAIPDAIAWRVIQEYMTPKFRQGDYAGGLADASAQLVKLIDGEQLPEPQAVSQQPVDRGADWLGALFFAFVVALVARAFLSWLPGGIRGIGVAVAAGGVAWLVSGAAFIALIGAVLGLFIGLMRASVNRYANQGGWGGWGGGGPMIGGGGWGGGGGFGGGGGWSGGGGMSGGGGASGGW